MLPQIKALSKQKKQSPVFSLPYVLIEAMLIQSKWPAQTDRPLMVTIKFQYCNFLLTAFSVA